MLLKNDPNYQKLKVGRRGLLKSVSYWLSDDHLLQVVVSGYVERYRRFRLSDVRAIHASRNSQRLLINLLAGLLLALTGALPLLTSGGSVVPLTWGIICTTLFGGVMVVNSMRGPSCTTRIITAVQKTTLDGITRMSAVEPLIDAVQLATVPSYPSSDTGSEPSNALRETPSEPATPTTEPPPDTTTA